MFRGSDHAAHGHCLGTNFLFKTHRVRAFQQFPITECIHDDGGRRLGTVDRESHHLGLGECPAHAVAIDAGNAFHCSDKGRNGAVSAADFKWNDGIDMLSRHSFIAVQCSDSLIDSRQLLQGHRGCTNHADAHHERIVPQISGRDKLSRTYLMQYPFGQ